MRPPIYKNIKKAMELADIYQAELARKTNLPQGTLNRIVNNVSADPKISTLMLIADALNVSINQLIGLEPLPGDGGQNYPTQKNFIPVLKWNEVMAYLGDSNYQCNLNKWLAVEEKQSANRCFALPTLPSHAPRFRENSLIIVNPTQQCDEDGMIALISFNGNEPALRRVMKDGGHLSFRKLHPEAGEKAEVLNDSDKVVGIVVETRFQEH